MVHEVNATLHLSERIVPGDELEVRFAYEPDWTHTALVSPAGKATFTQLDEIAVGGMTLAAVDDLLTRRYEGVLEKNDLSVRVKTPAPRTALILGEVREPGSYPVRDRYTIYDLIGDAEGFLKRTADLDALLLVRWIPDVQQMRYWYIDLDPEWWTCPEPLYIQPHDIVFIPNKPIDKVNIFVDQYIRLLLPFPYLYVPTVSY
jgi:polysaccharide export outer membrane protein